MTTKTKSIQKNVDTQELNIMLEQILNDKGDPEIIIAKREDMIDEISKCSKLMYLLICDNGIFHKLYEDEYDNWRKQILEFRELCDKIVSDTNLEYSEIKEHKTVKRLLLICRDLQPYKYYLENQGSDKVGFTGSWIYNQPGPSLQPFTFSDFNLKDIWLNDKTSDNMRKYILTIIKTIFDKGRVIFNLITTPDVDITQFSKVIIDAISKIKKVPELSRCNKAFKKLEQSIGLLEGNFGDYYKDMVQSQDPTLLIVNFIQDVSNSDGMDVGLVYEFRKIVNYYRKQTQGKIKDPELKKKFDMLSNRFSMLDKQVTKMTKDDADNDVNVDVNVEEESSDTDEETKEETKE
jgi:hypothetical protein